MDVSSLLGLLDLVTLLWFWFSSIHVLEIARTAGRNACDKAGVQFLDDTVSSTEIKIARNQSGRRSLLRTYRFEFTETGNTRIEGEIVVLGDTIESVTMDPYLFLQ